MLLVTLSPPPPGMKDLVSYKEESLVQIHVSGHQHRGSVAVA